MLGVDNTANDSKSVPLSSVLLLQLWMILGNETKMKKKNWLGPKTYIPILFLGAPGISNCGRRLFQMSDVRYLELCQSLKKVISKYIPSFKV